MVDEPLLNIAHAPQGELGGKNAGVLALILLEDVGLHRATHIGQYPGAQLGCLLLAGLAPVFVAEAIHALVNGGVEEHRQDGGRWTVDRHRHRRRRITQVESGVEHLHVVKRRDRDSGRADLAVDVRLLVGVAAVERDGVECRGQAGRRLSRGQQVEALVGALRVALTREHASGCLTLALEREYTRREGKVPRQVLFAQEGDKFAVVLRAWQRHPGDAVTRQCVATAAYAVRDRAP